MAAGESLPEPTGEPPVGTGVWDDLDTLRALPVLEELARMALTAEDDELAAQAGWMVRELGARILGLRLASQPATAVAAA